MLSTTIEAAFTPLHTEVMVQQGLLMDYGMRLDVWTCRIEDLEHAKGRSTEVTTIQADIIVFRKDVDELWSTDKSILWGRVDAHNESSSVPPLVTDQTIIF